MDDALAAGWEQLRGGRWEAARATFAAAAAGSGSAEAFEGLSWAAWWRDDAHAVFAARERAYALYRRRGDPAAAARVATWLAADELDFRGALSVAQGWLARARRLLAPLPEGPEHGWLAFHEGYVARICDDHAAAVERAAVAARLGERFGSRYMLAFCRSEYGAVHLFAGRWDEAERLLEAAVQDFTRSRPALAGAPLAGLAELRRRQARPADAARLLERAGASAAAQVCRARLALDRGDPGEALDLLERLLRRAPAAPLACAPALEALVEARVACDRLHAAGEAAAILRDMADRAGTVALRATADLADGVLAAATGDHDRARTLLEDGADGFAAVPAPYERARARVALAATLAALGRAAAAEHEANAALLALDELGATADAARARRRLGRAGAASTGALPELTAREREVLGLLAEGLTNRQIAARLVLSEHTVHRHVANILRKLGVPSRAAAAARAVRAGLPGAPRR